MTTAMHGVRKLHLNGYVTMKKNTHSLHCVDFDGVSSGLIIIESVWMECVIESRSNSPHIALDETHKRIPKRFLASNFPPHNREMFIKNTCWLWLPHRSVYTKARVENYPTDIFKTTHQSGCLSNNANTNSLNR